MKSLLIKHLYLLEILHCPSNRKHEKNQPRANAFMKPYNCTFNTYRAFVFSFVI